MSNKYKVTSYKKGPVYTNNKNIAITTAKEWAINTNRWGKVEKVIKKNLKRPDTVKQIYMCGVYEGMLTESFNEI